MRKTVCFTLFFMFLGVAWAVAGSSFSIKRPSGENYPRAYAITSGGTETQLEYSVHPAEMPLREIKPLPEYWYFPVALGPDQPEGVFLGDADTGQGQFIPLPGGRWCSNAHISPDGKLVALFLNKGDRMDLALCDLEAGRSVGTIRHAYAGGWVDSGRIVVNQFEPERRRYGSDEEGDYGKFWWSVAVCEVSSKKVGQPRVILRATEEDNYTVNSFRDYFILQRELVSAPDGPEKYLSMAVPLSFAEKAWVTGETCGIRDKGPASTASLDRILEPYVLQDDGQERVLALNATKVHMPVLSVPDNKPSYAWFAADGKKGIWLAIPNVGPGVFLPLEEAATCTAVYISPDESKLLLTLDSGTSLPRLAIYDLGTLQVTDVLPAADYPSWLDAARFAFVAFDPQKTPLGRPENVNRWESVALCDVDKSGKAKTHTLFQATEMENYYLMGPDWKTSELIIWQSFVLDPADWKDDVSGKEIRAPFSSSLPQDDAATAHETFFVRNSTENPQQKDAYRVTPAGEEILLDGVTVTMARMPGHGEMAGLKFYWFAVPRNQGNFVPGIFLTEPQAGIDMFLPLEQENPALCSSVSLSPDGDEVVLELKTEPLPSLAVYNIEQEQIVLTVPNADTPVWMDGSRFAYMSLDPAKRRTHNEGSVWCSVAFCERLHETEIKQEVLYQATETADYLLLDASPEPEELRILKIIVDSPEDWSEQGKNRVEEIREPYPAFG